MDLLSWLNPLNAITGALTKAYEVHENAKNDHDRIAAEVEIAGLEAKRDVVIAAAVNDKFWSPRTLMGWAVAFYVIKLVFWDSALGLGVTQDPGPTVNWIVSTVIAFYFVSKGAEEVAKVFAAGMVRKRT